MKDIILSPATVGRLFLGTVKTIVLIRHAKATKTSPDQKDEDRELNVLGFEQANKLGLKINDIKFDIVLSSPLKRVKETLGIATANRYNVVDVPALTCAVGDGNPIDVMFNKLGYVPLTKYFEHPLADHMKTWGREALEAILTNVKTRPNQNVLVGGHAVLQNVILWAIAESLQACANNFRADGAKCAEKIALEVALGEGEAFQLTTANHEAGMCSCEHIKPD